MSEFTTPDGKKILKEIEHALAQPFTFGGQQCEVVTVRMPKYSVLNFAANMKGDDNIKRLDHIVMSSSNIMGTDLPVTPDMYDMMSMYDVARLQGAANYFLGVYGEQLDWMDRTSPA